MGNERQRIDKWLFFARVTKSRTLAARMAQGGHVRVNGTKISQASHEVKPGDVLTMTMPRRVIVYRVLECGSRRGPATEARALYEDLSPPPPPKAASALDRASGRREPGSGRPTKKERRAIERLTGED
ncbi:RNA-binding S4 domain-containing protein [Oricola thermophila]|uniref:RNA-binding S4 domain-containing protein n=1 Tax=Oricola thermophila TaxID=2742145 RepID=A0A6N1VM99_9HYPH|nr:RNA-binding S4 domain-containing protein [Oricola thermophila]QKV20117.1 RNA-binding S4 domain-containing protein [Oricola thermophila]